MYIQKGDVTGGEDGVQTGGGGVREGMERNKNTDCGRRRRRGRVSPRHLLTDNLTNGQFPRCVLGGDAVSVFVLQPDQPASSNKKRASRLIDPAEQIKPAGERNPALFL